MELTTDQKGTIAETAIMAAAAKLGIGVYKPITDGERYDLIFRVEHRLLRVQCKWARRAGDVVIVLFRSCRRTREGLLHRKYTATEIDAVAAYSLGLDRCFFLPMDVFGGRSTVQLRVAPSRNNQKRGVHWADDYDFERLHWASLGAIAQLGERLRGTQKVGGSSPPGSITTSRKVPAWHSTCDGRSSARVDAPLGRPDLHDLDDREARVDVEAGRSEEGGADVPGEE
jgi:hypothetical protein